MKIGIIGPNQLIRGSLSKRRKLLDLVAKALAKSGHEIILTPDKNSLLEYFGNKYLEFGGSKIWLIVPNEEIKQNRYLNTSLGENISCVDWDKQADEFNRQSKIFICLGYSWGAMKEIACAKYSPKKEIYILKEFISSKLPKELNFLVKYITLDNLIRILTKN